MGAIADTKGELFLNSCNVSDPQQQFTIGDNGTIHAVSGGKCVDIWAAHGLPSGPDVDLYKCNGGGNQQFNFGANGILSSQGQLCLAGRTSSPTTEGVEI